MRRIESSGFTKVSALGIEEQRVNVILDLVRAGGESARLGDGYRVEARIAVFSRDAALVIPSGALVERAVETAFDKAESVLLNVRGHDFTTTTAIVNAINEKFSDGVARAIDGVSIAVTPTVTAQQAKATIAASLVK